MSMFLGYLYSYIVLQMKCVCINYEKGTVLYKEKGKPCTCVELDDMFCMFFVVKNVQLTCLTLYGGIKLFRAIRSL